MAEEEDERGDGQRRADGLLDDIKDGDRSECGHFEDVAVRLMLECFHERLESSQSLISSLRRCS